MRQYRGNHHIAKHIPLIDFLFGSFEKFQEMYEQVLRATTANQLDDLSAELHETRDQVLQMVRDEKVSITSAASRIGVGVSQALLWVKKAGIPYNARPRVLSQEREDQLITMLKAGRCWDSIIEQLGVKRSWLRAFLAVNVDIREDWTAKHAIVSRDKYREHLLLLLREHPGVPLKRIKAMPGNGFSWLYRNDPQWLAANLPLMPDAN
jgi:transposase